MKELKPTMNNTTGSWDKFYNETEFNYFFKNQGDKPYWVQRFIEPRESVMDMASGAGRIPFLIKQIRPNLEISVSDFSRRSLSDLEKMKDLFSEVTFLDITKIDREDNWYDVITACEVLEHLDDPKIAVKEMARVARRKIIVTTPYRENTADPSHKWAFTLDDMYDLLSPYGQTMVSVINGDSNILGVVWLS